MRGRIAASLALFAVLIVSLVAYVADADPVQVWNGDLDGSTNATKIVTGAKGQPLPTSGSGTLSWDGGAWYFGPAISPALAGQALFTDDAGAATTWAYPHGDVDASATDPGALTVNAIQGFGVSTSVPSTGNALVYSSGLWRPSAINLAGGSAYVTGTLPTANQASQTMAGDVTGTTAANVVASLTGSAGTVDVKATSLQADSANSSLTLGTNKTGATLNLQSGAASTTMQLDESGTNGDATIAHAGTTVFRSGHYNGGTTYTAVWLNGNAATPSATNYLFLQNGAGYTAMNAESGSLFLAVGNLNYVTLTSSLLSSTVPVSLGSSSGTNTLKGATDIAQMTAPAAPASGNVREYVDSADGRLKAMTPNGDVFVLTP